ncbi:uncharacterized protein LOC108261657 [Ictalurus punctatus]|uniref:Uncharacterized protein LOC108261657 n=1 Tax=Ictalurus punctatus TaxID=7998 RepID=A0A9F7R4L3_ICTPU|nr:uncharacterized protein LOC108261657 [Ictalurus punctatus]
MDTCHTTIYIYLMIAASVSPSEGDALEIFPAQIFGPSTAKVGENLELKCLISNIQSSNTEIHMYLCKNGVGERLELLVNKDEHTFTLRNISLRDSGTYSCVYSFTKYLPENVTGSGMNSIHVRVTGDALKIFPAQIFGPSTAKVGENVALTCSISNIQSSNTHVHMYLVKNGVGERLEPLGNKNEHTFTLRNISLLDSGTYSCVYSFTKYHPKNITGSGMNSIHVRVTGDEKSTVPTDPVKNAVVSLATLLLVGVVFIEMYRYRRIIHDKLCQNQGQSSEPANMNNSQGLGQVNQTVNRNEFYSDMGEYATIPEVGGNIRPLAAHDSANMVVYTLAVPSEIYSLVQEHENKPALQREAGQPEAAAVYAQVVKKKRKQLANDFFHPQYE